MRYRFGTWWRAAALCAAAAVQLGCEDDPTSCDQWKAAAKAYAAECNAIAYPPTDDEHVECKTDDELAKQAAAGDDAIASYTDLDACTAFLEDRRDDCAKWQALAYPDASPALIAVVDPNHAAIRARYEHCTFGAVASWTPPDAADSCEKLRTIYAYRSACDPALYAEVADDSTCVSDDAVPNLTNNRFKTVRECADYLYDIAYPCEVPLSDRELCSDLIVPGE